MGKSNAERQRKYRERHLADLEVHKRLNTLISGHTKYQLERLAYCVTA